MIRSPFDATSIPVLQEVIRFSQARHDVLAGNVANMDTPGYQVRDLSVDTFQERMKQALASRTPSADEPWSPGVLNADPGDQLRAVNEDLPTVLYHDETNVGMEQQVAEMSKNHYLHNLAITVMASQFRLLQTAVSERV